MVNPTELSFGQRIDPENGLVEPWLTHGALDWIKKQDWTDKKVLQYGSGLGDIWLAKRSKYLISIERNSDWAIKMQDYISKYKVDNYELHYRPCNENEGTSALYKTLPNPYNLADLEVYIPDVVIVDDAYRLECIQNIISLGIECTLIVDNFMQAFVFLNVDAKEILSPYKSLIFEQEDHEDHDGVNKWKTGIFILNKNNDSKPTKRTDRVDKAGRLG